MSIASNNRALSPGARLSRLRARRAECERQVSRLKREAAQAGGAFKTEVYMERRREVAEWARELAIANAAIARIEHRPNFPSRPQSAQVER